MTVCVVGGEAMCFVRIYKFSLYRYMCHLMYDLAAVLQYSMGWQCWGKISKAVSGFHDAAEISLRDCWKDLLHCALFWPDHTTANARSSFTTGGARRDARAPLLFVGSQGGLTEGPPVQSTNRSQKSAGARVCLCACVSE